MKRYKKILRTLFIILLILLALTGVCLVGSPPPPPPKREDPIEMTIEQVDTKNDKSEFRLEEKKS